jgi:uncharacterized protein YcfL
MYFTIKYNVLYKYIINATTTAINTCKQVIWRWSKGGNLFTLVINKGEHSIFLKENKYWYDRKGWEKESNTVKDAISFLL